MDNISTSTCAQDVFVCAMRFVSNENMTGESQFVSNPMNMTMWRTLPYLFLFSFIITWTFLLFFPLYKVHVHSYSVFKEWT